MKFAFAGDADAVILAVINNILDNFLSNNPYRIDIFLGVKGNGRLLQNPAKLAFQLQK